MVEGAALEMLCSVTRYRGFESHPLRHLWIVPRYLRQACYIRPSIGLSIGWLSDRFFTRGYSLVTPRSDRDRTTAFGEWVS